MATPISAGARHVTIQATGLGVGTGPQGPQGEQGLPGLNGVPTDEAVATYIGTPGTDMRVALDALYERLTRINVDTYGADPTGATSSDAAIALALAALGSDPGVLAFGIGTYTFSDPISLTAASQGIEGAGVGLTVLNYEGTGLALLVRPAAFATSNRTGPVRSFTLDGTGATAADGFEYGDCVGGQIDDIRVRNFDGVGVTFRNINGWTEHGMFRVASSDNATNFVFDGNDGVTSSASFMYNDFDLTTHVFADGDAVVMRESASLFGGRFALTFNADRGASNTGVILRIGSSGEVAASGLINVETNIIGEANGTGTNHTPIVMDGLGVIRAQGTIWFVNSGWPASTILAGRITFSGRYRIDSTTGRQAYELGTQVVGGIATRGSSLTVAGGAITLNPDTGTVFRTTLGNGAHTFALGGSVATGEATGLEFDIIVSLTQPSSGAAGTVNWGSIAWPEGTPSLKTANFAVDHFRLWTNGNGTWYGLHLNSGQRESGHFTGAPAFAIRAGSPGLSAAGTVPGAKWLLDDSAASEAVEAIVRVPAGWQTFTAKFLGVNIGANSGDIRIGRSISSIGADGAALIGGTLDSGDVTVTALAEGVRHAVIITSALTVPASRLLRVVMIRYGSHAGDTLTGDWGFVGVELTKVT